MRFGFSYAGLVYLIMLLIPNLIWAGNKPEDYNRYADVAHTAGGADTVLDFAQAHRKRLSLWRCEASHCRSQGLVLVRKRS